jgi:hypothetical protein
MSIVDFYQARRIFQYDYIYFDAIFLAAWVIVLICNREYRALVFGACVAPMLYFIDAHLWWSNNAGPHYPPGTYIREYWISGVQLSHRLGVYTWPKFGADFMMTISYALFTFPWLYIVLGEVRKGRLFTRKTLKYTALWLAMWLLVPALSLLIHWNDTAVETVRHIDSQFPWWIGNLLVGYGLIAFVYRRSRIVAAKLLAVGMVGALVMELPLYLFRIRPTGIVFLLFEGFFLLNQGVPYVYLFLDKAVPGIGRLVSHVQG